MKHSSITKLVVLFPIVAFFAGWIWSGITVYINADRIYSDIVLNGSFGEKFVINLKGGEEYIRRTLPIDTIWRNWWMPVAGTFLSGLLYSFLMTKRTSQVESKSIPSELSDLSELHRNGSLSEDEFKRAKDEILKKSA